MTWFLLLPLLCLPLGYWLMIMMMHRSPVHQATVIMEDHAPAGLTPLTAGVLLDGRLKPRHLLAAVVDLAQRGGLAISEVDGAMRLAVGRAQASKSTDLLLRRILFDGADSVSLGEAGERLLDSRHALTAHSETMLLERDLVRQQDWGATALFGFGIFLTLGVILLIFIRFGFLAGLGVGLPLLVLAQFAQVAATWRLPPTVAGLDVIGHLEGYRRRLMDAASGAVVLTGGSEPHLPFALALDVALPLSEEMTARQKLFEQLWP